MFNKVENYEEELNKMVSKGQIKEAFEKFYDKYVVMEENLDVHIEGYEENYNREMEFMGGIKKMHKYDLLAMAVNGNVSFSEWDIDIEFKNGAHMKGVQVAVRHWTNGKIVHERFYHGDM